MEDALLGKFIVIIGDNHTLVTEDSYQVFDLRKSFAYKVPSWWGT